VLAALEDMPGLALLAIVVLAVGKLERLHRARQWPVARLQQQVNMVGHEDVDMQRYAIALAIALETLWQAAEKLELSETDAPPNHSHEPSKPIRDGVTLAAVS
jgi:hypothetical protein